MIYTTFNAGDKEYKCRLTAMRMIDLEEKMGKNPILVISNGDLPTLKDMLTIFHAMLQEYEHGIKFEDACAIYDKYTEDHDQTQFFWFLLKALQNDGYLSREVDFDGLEKDSKAEAEKAVKSSKRKN